MTILLNLAMQRLCAMSIVGQVEGKLEMGLGVEDSELRYDAVKERLSYMVLMKERTMS